MGTTRINSSSSFKTIGSGLQKGIWDDRVYIMDREHQQEQVEAGSWCGKPGSGSSSAIRWSNPFAVDPIAASWHIVSARSLVVYCRWSRIPPTGDQGPFRPVIKEHFAVPSPSLQMMLPIPRQVPLLTKQILSIKPYSTLSTPIMRPIPKPESCARMTAARTNRGAFLSKSKIWAVPPSLKAKSISKKGSNAKFQKQVPKEKPKTKNQIRGLY
ncbi:hypothetical protein PHYBLDRAFT_147466 [Phycomyces blakesleeanus NRRL 1555(-)]|uniref:Uncharacterized protein n=1 Tax=Phycomyces blakesleeanus (strain ATCC 8743b / DSM 1359 / FGSC 10004 / NBRC 33097 / NRRL 1555) TaxID=763407 RepID=A0A162PPI7_PHYB8|nr:hypothetical protein PHYBLDRAFT_147466 [Phycomyces blakesleeanus NRRL 1555(-)]OAD71716.1 hypothetical protein PHYBLDRAFT_147466 [Phycomyces blakesleeanus NRRL 1555(-)]|eukprot:XP_018289756.1 hypothetical protein PHYBLDRAFT_147466 [Phycomyces blakesleeanus NRRL 1555(-)]